MKLDINSLTNREIIEIEELAGMPFGAIGTGLQSGDRPMGKALAALTFVALKRDNPAATWEQALDTPGLQVFGDADPQLPPPAPNG